MKSARDAMALLGCFALGVAVGQEHDQAFAGVAAALIAGLIGGFMAAAGGIVLWLVHIEKSAPPVTRGLYDFPPPPPPKKRDPA